MSVTGKADNARETVPYRPGLKVLLQRADLRIPLIYAIFGGLWVVLSDRLLAGLFADISLLTSFQTYKGWAFVGASTVLVYLLLHREIGRRERVEQTLKENSGFTANLLENSPFAIYITGADHRLRLVNGQWEKDLDIPRAQAVGRPLVQIFPAEIADRLNRDNQNVIESGSRLELEEEVHGRHYLTIKFPVRDALGGIAGVGGVSLDVTERKRAEAQLTRQAQLLDKVNDAVIAADENYVVTSWNRAAEQIYGWKAEEAIGQRSEELLKTEFVAATRAQVRQQLRETGEWSGEVVQQRRDGSQIFVDASSGVLRDETERVLGYLSVNRNITERKQMELTLEESRRRLQALFDYSQDAILLADDNSLYIDVNPAACTLFGYTREEMLRLSVWDLTPLPDRELGNRLWRQFIAEGLQSGEFTIRRSSGENIAVEYRSVANILPGVHLSITRDISEHRRTEEALRASEERWRTIFAAANDAILLLDEQYEIIAHNQAAEDMYGEPPTGRSLFDLRPAHLREEGLLRMQQAIREAGGRWETYHVRANGSIFPVEASTKPFESGGKRQFIHIVRDITAHRQLEEYLREAELKYRTLVEQIPPIVYLAEADQHIGVTYISPRVGMLGFSQEEWIADPELWLRQIHPDDRPGVLEQLGRIRNTGKPAVLEYRLLARDGAVRWFLDETMDVLDEDGRFVIRQGIMLDITERKQVEQDLRQSRDRLAQISRQLSRVRENEQRAIGRELHDQIGQMLTAIRITLKILPELPPERAAQKIQRALEITDELLERVSRLSLKLRPHMLDDLGLIPALIWHINQFQEETAIQVEFRHSGLEGRRFDSEQETNAYRIVQEALTNMARHSGAAHARIEIRADRGSGDRDGLLEIRVEDDGRGFDPEAALAKNRGLSGMRERTRLLGGVFQIDSQTGAGTRTLIRLPLQMEAP